MPPIIPRPSCPRPAAPLLHCSLEGGATSAEVAMGEAYDESQELYRYVSFSRRELMTPQERRAERLGMLREKARHSDSERVRKMLLDQYELEADGQALQS